MAHNSSGKIVGVRYDLPAYHLNTNHQIPLLFVSLSFFQFKCPWKKVSKKARQFHKQDTIINSKHKHITDTNTIKPVQRIKLTQYQLKCLSYIKFYPSFETDNLGIMKILHITNPVWQLEMDRIRHLVI